MRRFSKSAAVNRAATPTLPRKERVGDVPHSLRYSFILNLNAPEPDCATLIKADGNDIPSVRIHLKAEADAEADAEKLSPNHRQRSLAWR
jgi:hypothetical protein